ncbi:lycopene cyclase domain-containing protein [Phytomonospora endophytica]|uniref:Lycopene cyclase domain-containing protein n=1 Tax=Phytomonospora endophytica TaxID=714109 RepID=A0A841FBR8_9ACTN|nr:lycopene cyclase domain-containing protein [Phytomonospora endophytica]MBB6033706.1 lycopene cyclase domain-containing protein [Phytomonospora endophytica]GIG64776.1 lycopene cyclase [Phytomonospora endophytica]
MRQLIYLGVLLGCLVCAGWLEPVLKTRVLARHRRVLRTIALVAIPFLLIDTAAILAGWWWFDGDAVIGAYLPGGVPLEEVLFFVVVPVCAILGFEAVRTVLGRLGKAER